MTKSHESHRIGAHDFDPGTGEVAGPEAVATTLRPQTARVLSALLDRRGEVVGKADLMDIVWPDTAVTDDSLVQCISEIRKALGADGQLLRTMPRRGYLLQAPETAPAAQAPAARGRRLATFVTAVAVVLFAAVAAGALWRPKPATSPMTIAVLPFRNMAGSADTDYLALGVAEDLIVSLSRIADLRVLSRGTTFSLAGEDRDMRELATLLRADYILDGSVRRTPDDLRLSASLVDGRTGANVWADRYEGTAGDIFAFQDEVLAELVRVLSVRLSRSERERLGVRGTVNVAAYDAYLRGRELENLYTVDTNHAAEAALTEALRADPDFALAHAHLSQVYSFRVENRWSEQPERDIEAAFASARRAVELDPDLPFAHFALGRLYTRSYAPDGEKAVAEYEKAIALDPNYVDAYMFLANVHIFNGAAEKALPLIADGFDRNPVPPFWYYLADGMAHYFLKDYETAEARLVEARDRNPTAPFPYRFLMATYGQLGEVDEAEWMAMEYEALGRSATIADLVETASIQDPAYRAHFVEGFRKAGLPEG